MDEEGEEDWGDEGGVEDGDGDVDVDEGVRGGKASSVHGLVRSFVV